MGVSHAATGVAAWLGGCATAAVLGIEPSPYVVVVGTALCAFGAIWPDIDHPSASIAQSFGKPTEWLSRLVAGFGEWLYSATGTRRDGRDEDGHRTISHTVLFCVLTFLGFGYLGEHGGMWGPLVTIAVATATALRALKVRGTQRFLLTALVVVVAFYWPPPDGWWLGWAVGGGALVHNLGDRMTNTGVPLLWPIKIRGRRWYKFRANRWVRFSTGEKGNPEPAIQWCCGLVCTVALLMVAYFRWPPFAGYVDQVMEAAGRAVAS